MINQNYTYSNNAEFPIRYIVSRGRSSAANTVLCEDSRTGEINEINLNQNSLSNLNKGFKTLGVSKSTQKKIAKHCKVLGLASTPRTVRNSNGKYVAHLTTFITLTLPAEQIHTDPEITKHILGKFLDKSRKIGLLKNYVWRAEKQTNKNIHYHILTDTFANFSLFQKLWFLACREFDYLNRYTSKFSKMNFEDYKNQNFNHGKDIKKIANAYALGVRNQWRKPPSIHVTYITNISGVARYVSKYISKNENENSNIVTGRTWGASQSITKSVSNLCKDFELSKYWYQLGAELMNCKILLHDYFSVVLFKITSLFAWFPESKEMVFNLLRKEFEPCQYWRNSVGMFEKI